jgi:sugar O-acyltransferase (sialic acid O-acetyltransferase NeuD family)
MFYEIALVGNGGFAREVMAHMGCTCTRFVDDIYYNKPLQNVYKLSDFSGARYRLLIAIGDPLVRKDIVNKLPKETKYGNYVSNKAIILSFVHFGYGDIICAGVILTTNIKIGNHVHINLGSTIGHDVVIGDFVTISPGVNVSGNCTIDDFVYIGSGAVIREKLSICDHVTIGMGAVVVKDIIEPGVYVGNPAKRIR